MKILILGATGRTGKLLLSEALARGHQVHVLVRDKDKVTVGNSRLGIFEGLPTRGKDLSAAMQGCEAVMSVLNISRNSDFPWSKLRTPLDFLSVTIKNVISQCENEGVNRVVVMSAYGVAETRASLPAPFRWLIDHSNIGAAYREHENQELLLEQSSLEWTVVRPVGLTNATGNQEVDVALDAATKLKMTISRRAAAHFMLDCIEQGLYIRQRPNIAAR